MEQACQVFGKRFTLVLNCDRFLIVAAVFDIYVCPKLEFGEVLGLRLVMTLPFKTANEAHAFVQAPRTCRLPCHAA